MFADGSANTYHYTSLGMRQRTEYDFGASVDYRHTASGSLIETRVTNHDGRSNISRGRVILNSSLNSANQVPNRVRTNVARGMGPFPNATNFTNAQTRLEAIHRYNAGTAWDLGYWEWNNSMGQWVSDPQGGTAGYANSVAGRSPSC